MDTGNCIFEVMEFPDKLKYDKAQYRIIRLANETKVMLVHDDRVHENEDENHSRWPACALSVGVGSSSDPSDLQGLAIFLGKYPEYPLFIPKCEWLIPFVN